MPRPGSDRANLFLVRAGRTPLSVEERFPGRLDSGLDDLGIAQARMAASALAVEGVATVLTSPLRRARETAEVLAETCAARVAVVHELTDVDAGAWTGLTREEAAAATPDGFDLFVRFPASATMPSGERMWSAQERVLGALRSIRYRGGGSVVAVTHELPIRLVLLRLRRLEGTALWDPVVAPGSITRLRVTPSGLEIPTVLEDLLRAARRGQG
jgi:broad specificity phosphatase PhoE